MRIWTFQLGEDGPKTAQPGTDKADSRRKAAKVLRVPPRDLHRLQEVKTAGNRTFGQHSPRLVLPRAKD